MLSKSFGRRKNFIDCAFRKNVSDTTKRNMNLLLVNNIVSRSVSLLFVVDDTTVETR